MDEAKPISLALRLKAAGIPKSHAYQIAAKAKAGRLTLPVALRTWKATRIKLGPLADASEAKIADLMKFAGIAA